MRAVLAVAMETFLRLRRDRMFIPAALVGLGLLALSGLASYWGVEEFFKILYDLGTTAFLFTGSTVAIFWGNKIIADSRQEGSIEVQLTSPLSRSAWLFGKFLGLTAGLFMMAIVLVAGWQAIYAAYGMGWIPQQDIIIFALLSMIWIIMGAASILFASLASGAIALFCTIWLFIVGLISAPITQALAPDTPAETRKAVEILAGLWNLHSFNLGTYGGGQQTAFIDRVELLSRFGYGLTLIALFVSLACVSFQRRDIIA